jgi:hypothetical protein
MFNATLSERNVTRFGYWNQDRNLILLFGVSPFIVSLMTPMSTKYAWLTAFQGQQQCLA